jgi:phosphatidylglycerol---prolipoprotein diacylglyceryl transferase
MHPDLVRLGGGALHTYGVALALAFLVGITVARRQARREGADADGVLHLAFWLLVSGFAGSRILEVLTDLGSYVAQCRGAGPPRTTAAVLWDCTAALHLWEGGLAWYGGFLAALGFSVLYVRRRRMGFLRTADILVPSVALGHFLGRLGCFAAGCCYGKPTTSALGVEFGPLSLAFHDLAQAGAGAMPRGASGTPPLHPAQLYEALGELLIFAGLLFLRRRKRFHGQLLLAYLLAYPLLRGLVEIFRGDAARGFLALWQTPALNAALGLPPNEASFLSVPQGLSLVVAVAALAVLWTVRRPKPCADPA